jgi:hypothetical protein
MKLSAYLKDLERNPSVAKVNELAALIGWLQSGDPEGRVRWLTLRLSRESEKYRSRGIPIEQWPGGLQGDIKQRIRERLHIPCVNEVVDSK